MSKTYTTFSTRRTLQSEPILGEAQIENSAGGFVYQLDDFKAFERFLILGSEGGTYYIGERKLTRDNAERTVKVINADGRRAVDLIVAVSDEGRAVKNDPAIFALALAASAGSPDTRAYALAQLPKVCRIPTHLFHFLTYVKQFRGFGRGLKRAVAAWYNDQPVDRLAYQLAKYQQRDGWSNADALRRAHPLTTDPIRQAIYRWAVDGTAGFDGSKEYRSHAGELPPVIRSFEYAKTTVNAEGVMELDRLLNLIKLGGLSREMVPTEALLRPEVWEALLPTMNYQALLRNLGNMSKVGLLKPLSETSKFICGKLRDQEALQKRRVHPIEILVAMKIYSQGKGLKGSGTWTPVPAVVEALNDGFYLAFKTMRPTGKRLLFGVDVSGSMGAQIANLPLTCAEGAAAMALACAKTEQEFYIMGFTAGPAGGRGNTWFYDRSGQAGSVNNGFKDLGITPSMSLNEALERTRNQNFGGTDCAVPMLWATKNKINVDAFIVITDSETWAGEIHPSQALREYRQKMGIASRQIVIGMTATNFTIADPKDPLTLDIAGFDTSVPQALQEFVR